MITIRLIPGVASKAGRVSGAEPKDEARARVNGVLYTTSSARGACCKLARELMAAGIPDQPWEARTPEGRRTISGSSLHGLATLTINADARFVKWKPHPGSFDGEPVDAA